jgi:hypothetical protein
MTRGKRTHQANVIATGKDKHGINTEVEHAAPHAAPVLATEVYRSPQKDNSPRTSAKKSTHRQTKETSPESQPKDEEPVVSQTYTATTIDLSKIQGNIQALSYDQQDGITKATNVTLPEGSVPDIVPGVPNVPLSSVFGVNNTQGLGAVPLPDVIPGVPNVPAIFTNADSTAQIQADDVELKQVLRFAQQ